MERECQKEILKLIPTHLPESRSNNFIKSNSRSVSRVTSLSQDRNRIHLENFVVYFVIYFHNLLSKKSALIVKYMK